MRFCHCVAIAFVSYADAAFESLSSVKLILSPLATTGQHHIRYFSSHNSCGSQGKDL